MAKNVSHFLAVVPDEQANNRIKRVLAEVGALFDAHGIPIRLAKPDSFHVTLLFMGKKVGWSTRKIREYKIKKHPLRGDKISFGKIRLGISRNYRELLILTMDDGAEELRNMVYELSPKLGVKRDHMFIPHLSLGRVSKELTDQEFRNLSESIMQLNGKLEEFIDEITFNLDALYWIKSEDGVYTTLKKFDVASMAS